MRIFLILFVLVAVIEAKRLGVVSGVTLDLPLPNMRIETFIDRSIGHEPKALVKDGLPFFGSKRGDFERKERRHKGYDIYLNHTDVIASASGSVKEIAHGKLSGIHIKLQHTNNLETLYIHLSSVCVKKGDKVKKGDIIGRIDGPSGNAIAPQLHFEIKLNGLHLDPLVFIKQYYHDRKLLAKIVENMQLMKGLVLKRDALVKVYLEGH